MKMDILRRFRVLAVAIILAAIATFGAAETNYAKDDKNVTGKSKFAKLDGAKIHYVNYGKGSDALVLIHGWTMNADNWRDQIQDFASRYHVIAIDLPGHGQSDKPQVSYSMDYFARAVEAVMKDAKAKRAVLVGHSMGTPVARQFYRKYPQKTLAIVIVDGVAPAAGRQGDDGWHDRGVSVLPPINRASTRCSSHMKGPNLSAEAMERIKASSAEYAAARCSERDGRNGRPGDLGRRQNQRAGAGNHGAESVLPAQHRGDFPRSSHQTWISGCGRSGPLRHDG